MFRYLLPPSIALLVTLAALAQTVSSTGAIQGTIVDPTGAVIVGTKVLARNVNSGIGRTAETDANGQFSFFGLLIGTYTLRLEKEGFNPVEVSPFLVSVGQTVIQNLSLQLGGVVGKVDVREQSDVVESAATTSSVALGYDRIEEAPARSRNYLNFVNLAPGLVPSSGSSSQKSVTGVRSPLVDSGFSFGGLRGGTIQSTLTAQTTGTRPLAGTESP